MLTHTKKHEGKAATRSFKRYAYNGKLCESMGNETLTRIPRLCVDGRWHINLVSSTTMAWAWGGMAWLGMAWAGWHDDGWGLCSGIAVFRRLKFVTLRSVSGVSKARPYPKPLGGQMGREPARGPRATVATRREPAVHYYRGFSLHLCCTLHYILYLVDPQSS